MEEIRIALNGDENSVQKTLSIFLLALSVFQLVYGFLIDIFGRKNILLAGTVIYSISAFLCTFSN